MKGFSNWEIAGFLRNILRYSINVHNTVEHSSIDALSTISGNSEHVINKNIESQTISGEVYSREGNSPEILLRSLIVFKF